MEHQTQYVGIDLHRRRSVIVRRSEAGETLDKVRSTTTRLPWRPRWPRPARIQMWSSRPPMAGTGRLTSSKSAGRSVHLAHPLGNNWGHRRVKNDERDATDLVDLLRMGRLAEAWIAPPPLRELRELVRYRAKLVQLRSNFKAQVHAVLAKEGVTVPMSDLFGVGGRRLLDEFAWPTPTASGWSRCST